MHPDLTLLGGRLLVIGPWPEPKGGVSIHVRRFCERLKEGGASPGLIDESRVVKSGIPNLRQMGYLTYLRLLAAHTIIHVHSGNSWVRLAHVVAGRLLGRKVVLTVHSFRGSSATRLLTWLAAYLSTRVIAVSADIARSLHGQVLVAPAFIRPVATELSASEQIRRRFDAWRSEGKIVMVANASRIVEYKGHDLYGLDLLVELFERPEIRSRYACWFAISAGDPKQAEVVSAKEKLRELRAIDQFEIDFSSCDFSGLIEISDIFVRPTRSDGDAISIREALLLGRKVVASNCSVRPPSVILFESGNSEALADALAQADTARTPPVSAEDYFWDVVECYQGLLEPCGASRSTASTG